MAAAVLMSGAASSFADHSRRFLLVTDFGLPHAGERFFVSDFSGSLFGSDWDLEFSPGLLLALGTDGMTAAELHLHAAKAGSGPWIHEGTGLELRRKLIVMPSGWNLTAGLEAERAREGGPTPWSLKMIAGREDASSLLALNLNASNPEGLDGRTFWGYGIGYSPKGTGLPFGLSLELVGSLESGGDHFAMIGGIKECGTGSLLKLGLGTGLTKDSPDFGFRMGWTLRF